MNFRSVDLMGALVAGMLFSLSSVAHADLMGIYSGNDQEDSVESVLGVDVDLFGKVECEADFIQTEGAGVIVLNSTSGCPGSTGFWSTSGEVAYMTIKAGNQFALYEFDPSLSSGSWDTSPLQVGSGQTPTISHITFWQKETSLIPEPAMWALIIVALLGLVFVGRRYKRK
jgi:hypothetical protein